MPHSDSGACRTLIPDEGAHFLGNKRGKKTLVNPKYGMLAS